jgi:hypothetical protein
MVVLSFPLLRELPVRSRDFSLSGHRFPKEYSLDLSVSMRAGLKPQQFSSWAYPTLTRASGNMIVVAVTKRIFHSFIFFHLLWQSTMHVDINTMNFLLIRRSKSLEQVQADYAICPCKSRQCLILAGEEVKYAINSLV